jgi:chromosome segregation ATPase
LDLWKKTDEAKKKFEKLEKSKECNVKEEKMTEEKMRLFSLLSESKKELESLSGLARNLQSEIKKLNKDVKVYVIDVNSDDENITTRRVMLRSPSTTPLWNRSTLAVAKTTTTKRKLEDMTSSSVKSGLDNIYQFGDSSDSEGQSGVRAGLGIGGELPPRHQVRGTA